MACASELTVNVSVRTAGTRARLHFRLAELRLGCLETELHNYFKKLGGVGAPTIVILHKVHDAEAAPRLEILRDGDGYLEEGDEFAAFEMFQCAPVDFERLVLVEGQYKDQVPGTSIPVYCGAFHLSTEDHALFEEAFQFDSNDQVVVRGMSVFKNREESDLVEFEGKRIAEVIEEESQQLKDELVREWVRFCFIFHCVHEV